MRTHTLKKGNYVYTVTNEEEFERIYSDIFGSQEYRFSSEKEQPFVIDCGAHVGVGLTYYHSLYPHARIIAFEPNPKTYSLLRQNMAQNHIDAKLVQAAVAGSESKREFYISKDEDEPWSWGDSLVKNAWYSPDTTASIEVPSIILSRYITEPVDLLKIDVEGLETEVIKEIADKLPMIKEMYLEFHGSSRNPSNQLDTILSTLRQSSFDYTLQEFGTVVDRDNISKDDPNWVIVHALRSVND